MEGLTPDSAYPATTVSSDGWHGAKLYRANIPHRLVRRNPLAPAHAPVQLIIPTRDRFISASYYDAAAQVAPELLRHEVPGSHWVPRAQPDLIAGAGCRVRRRARGDGARPGLRAGDLITRAREGVGALGAKRTSMLLKHRSPGIDAKSVTPRAGLEHLDRNSIAVLRWLNASHVDYVVVGPVAHAIRGDQAAKGPVAIVPAPYSRNWDRLTRALIAEHAGLRSDRGLPGSAERGDTVSVKLTPDKLARGRRWMLRFGGFDLDIEGSGARAAGARGNGHGHSGEDGTRAPRYQELLYEANRFEVADGVSIEVASPEDLEHFSHVRRTGTAPEFRVTRNPGVEDMPGDGESLRRSRRLVADQPESEGSGTASEAAPDA